MAGPLGLGRTRAMVVEEDWDFGIKLADGLAAEGYHPVLFRSVDVAIAELRSIRPRVILIGRRCAEPAVQVDTTDALRLIQTMTARVPVTTLAETGDEDLTTIVVRYGAGRVGFNTVEFSGVGQALHQVLRSELNEATV